MSASSLTGGDIARGLDGALRNDWPIRRSSEIFELRYGKALVASVRRAGDVPVYGTNGQTGTHDERLFTGPGVIVGRKGAGHLGVHWSDKDFWVIDTAYSLVPSEDVDLRFAYYLVKYVGLNHLKHGTSNPSLTRDAFGHQYFPVPPRPEQRAIAATLGALDDKIESNRRAIDYAQRIAASVFQSWRKEAPVKETTTFGAYTEVFGGSTPKTSVPNYWGGELAWTTPTDVTGLESPYLFATSRTITEAGLQSCTTLMHPAGTIFMTSRATIGAFAINQIPAATNQGFIAVRPRREDDRWFLFEEMRSRVEEFIYNANGSTFLEISRGSFKELPLNVPHPDAIAQLDRSLEPLHAKASQLEMEAQRLTALRDTLLPELLTGRIHVPVEEHTA
ncbi:restriction endonuclease subunit S [Arthrobacter sp. MYb213]|uniref:restriction endonuclease subunit S n=1 Tax=Arthrobacter sp. MYb213 TaxID=1848595 RepID=UPI000CFC8E7E|nr:restriction endonuclease subunit S [Arthrobacter sp. MYb213]PRB71344.1 hypothetical protein CQ011_05425 [Arthrobacter sp. MYb213]